MSFKQLNINQQVNNVNVLKGLSLPASMVWGDACEEGHGVNNKNLRYKKNGKCVACDKKPIQHKRKLTALDYQELQQEKQWLLSDY